MRPVILQLDDAFERQVRFERRVRASGGQVIACRDIGPALRLWSRPSTLAQLKRRLETGLPVQEQGEVVFAGSGDFHHVTPLLLERAVARAGGPVTVIHFDNHPDWVRQSPGLHCGSWVGPAARLEGVAGVITVGVCSHDISRAKSARGDLALITEGRLEIFAWDAPDGGDHVALSGRRWPTIAALGEAAFLGALVSTVRARAIYVTIDKDVLRPQDAVTNWDQGRASLDFVIAAVRRLAESCRVVGADVVGDWSTPIYGGGRGAGLLKRAEALLDQPWTRKRPLEASELNQAVNLRLLDLFVGLTA